MPKSLPIPATKQHLNFYGYPLSADDFFRLQKGNRSICLQKIDTQMEWIFNGNTRSIQPLPIHVMEAVVLLAHWSLPNSMCHISLVLCLKMVLLSNTLQRGLLPAHKRGKSINFLAYFPEDL